MFVADARWIDLATTATYGTIRRICAPNSCIEAGCIAVGVAEAFGFLCEPVPLAVRVVAGKQWTMLPGPGSDRRDGFVGHLGVFYPGAGTLVDLTAPQFHNVKRGLLVPEPLIVPVEREDLVGGIELTLSTGTRVAYREMVDDVSWRSTPAWYESSAVTTAVVLGRLRVLMAAAAVKAEG